MVRLAPCLAAAALVVSGCASHATTSHTSVPLRGGVDGRLAGWEVERLPGEAAGEAHLHLVLAAPDGVASDAVPDADVEIVACHFPERSYHGDGAHGYS